MTKIMVLDTDYPSPHKLYSNVFVHTRVKEYIKFVEVNVVSFFRDWEDYEYEGIFVRHAPNIDDIFKEYNRYKPGALFIHFYDRRLFEFIKSLNIPVIVWVHGYEAIGWYRRLFNYSTRSLLRNMPSIIWNNLKQMFGFRQLINYSNTTDKVHFVFVSNWMKSISEIDSFLARIKNYSIIPNPINCSLFQYQEKDTELRKRILMIRSFFTKKYATDVAASAIVKLSKHPFFKDLKFSIYGQGRYFEKVTDPIKKFANVSLHNYFLPNSKIPSIHREHGIFLCPTRQDAQGVSMCEAMASGLVPLTTNCTAIFEFVDHEKSGFLTTSIRELADAIEKLYYNPSLFKELSFNAAQAIKAKCDIENVVKKELELISTINIH